MVPVQLDEYPDLPRAMLPPHVDVHICSTEGEIQSACNAILEEIMDDSAVIQVGFDMEWEFNNDQSSKSSHKTALIQLACFTAVYLLRVHLLKILPGSLKTILTSSQIVKIGRNVGGDYAKLSRDFPDFTPPPRHRGKLVGVVELGAFAKAKNAVVNGNVSLATITAASLGLNLSKEARLSEWGAPQLSEEQKHYAALDAWIALEIWTIFRDKYTIKSCCTCRLSY